MSRIAFLQDVLASVFDQRSRFRFERDKRGIVELCEALMSEQGEVSGTKIASSVLTKYQSLDETEKVEFFQCLAENYDLEPDLVIEAAQEYASDKSPKALKKLTQASEPRRQELLRRLNQVPGATETLVHMREDMLPLLREKPELAVADSDFEHLFSSWFNRGFLVLKPIDWRTPANILEKIIAYEAVHAINDWDDLRRRLQPADRRCFAFFHPVMPEEPLIFVEVAFTKGVPDSISELLAETRDALLPEDADTAVFYSISNCQVGLKGVSFGNFLIKQVANDLARDFSNLKNFVTLSPVPGFSRWFEKEFADSDNSVIQEIRAAIDAGDVGERVTQLAPLEKQLTKLMAEYMVDAKHRSGMPLDPVSRFHLGNGASLARINWMADQSANGITQSYGMMVNYRYDLGSVESNHESYVNEKEVHTTREIRNLAKSELK